MFMLLAALAPSFAEFRQSAGDYQYRPGNIKKAVADPTHIVGEEVQAEENYQYRHGFVVHAVALRSIFHFLNYEIILPDL